MEQYPTARNNPTPDLLLALFATLIGLVVRLAPPLSVAFPINDGGLFYQMIEDLISNHFRLPAFTTYNSSNIPFAYPPFGFYFTGILSIAFHFDLLTLLRILPPIICSLTVPAFYFLARKIIKTGQVTALAAVLAFALTPRGFELLIMGGGITRTFGLLFALLTIHAAYVLFTGRSYRHLLTVVAFGTLTLLSHPEASAQTALVGLLFYLILDHSWKGALYSIAAAAGILTLSAPWWMTVVARHGIGPYAAIINAARDGTFVTIGGRIFLTFQFLFTDERYLPLIAVIGLVGFWACLWKREYLVPIWVTAPLFFEPRSAPQYMIIPLSILTGIGLVEVLIPALINIGKGIPDAPKWVVGTLIAYLFLYCLISAYVVGFQIADSDTFMTSGRQAFIWLKDHTPADSRFIILSNGGPLYDPLAEWFPALTARTSLNTVFGTEWLENQSLRKNIARYSDLQACISRDLGCIQEWSKKYSVWYTHILLREQVTPTILSTTLQSSTDYQKIYDSQGFAIFERLH